MYSDDGKLSPLFAPADENFPPGGIEDESQAAMKFEVRDQGPHQERPSRIFFSTLWRAQASKLVVQAAS